MSDIFSHPLLALVKERNLIDDLQAEEVLQEHTRSGKPIDQILSDFGLVDTDSQLQIVAEHLGTEVVALNGADLDPEVIKAIPGSVARMYQCVPVAVFDSVVQLALVDPLNPAVIDELGFSVGKEIQIVVADRGSIEKLVSKYYSEESESVGDILAQLGADKALEAEATTEGPERADLANEVPLLSFVNLVLYQAVQDRASDIHFEPFETEFKIRYRVDGALYEMAPPPRHLALPVTSRLKVMANLNIAERRLPQDGRIQMMMVGKPIDLRISTLPTVFGESLVLRVLDRTTVNLDIETLGMPDYIYNYLLDTIEKPNGIFIVTGPTGSGETTTLYACLNKINTIDSKVLTAEDPVEYDIEGIIQVPMNEGIGLTFARTLRAFLRQDPDRIMVGETRDVETAQIAIQASLTGHLVFTTLHTNDAPGAVTRLIDMGVEPFMISSSLEGVLGQRLIRKICLSCRTPYEPNEATLAQLGLSPHEIGDKSFYYGVGCEACNHTGYKGRKGIYELLDITDPIREMINKRRPSVVVTQKAIELGIIQL